MGLSTAKIVDGFYIMMHDEIFVGSDKRVQEVLASRSKLPAALESLLTYKNNTAEPTANPDYIDPDMDARRQRWPIGESDIEGRALRVIKRLVYSVQNKLKELEPTLSKYQQDERYRFGHIFSKLEEWRKKILVLHGKASVEKNATVYEHLITYQHMLATDVDVTLTIEYLVRSHDVYWRKLQRNRKP